MWHQWFEPFIESYELLDLFAGVLLEPIGLPLPGETLLAIASGMAATGSFNIRAVALVAVVGAAVGDNIGFLIGRNFGRPVMLRRGARFGITHERLARVEAALDHRGAAIIVVARFVPLLRQLDGLAAGTAGMHWLRFFVANALGAALWVGAWTTRAFWTAPGTCAREGAMSRKPASEPTTKKAQPREDRLKAALKANMARRKAQARARAAKPACAKRSPKRSIW